MKFWLYVIKAFWLFVRGRWYVWRDIPTDVVRKVGLLWYFDRKNEKNEFVYEAYKEYQLRKMKEKKMIPFPKYNEKGELDKRLTIDPVTGYVGIGTPKGNIKYPSCCCPKCGEHIGWLGRVMLFHKCKDKNT